MEKGSRLERVIKGSKKGVEREYVRGHKKLLTCYLYLGLQRYFLKVLNMLLMLVFYEIVSAIREKYGISIYGSLKVNI